MKPFKNLHQNESFKNIKHQIFKMEPFKTQEFLKFNVSKQKYPETPKVTFSLKKITYLISIVTQTLSFSDLT